MTWSGIVLFENWVMNNCRSHSKKVRRASSPPLNLSDQTPRPTLFRNLRVQLCGAVFVDALQNPVLLERSILISQIEVRDS